MLIETAELNAFRCIREARLDFHPRLNLILGKNASGKTSLLEALFFLGRGRSFRTSQAASLIHWESDAFRIVAKTDDGPAKHRLGLEYERQGFRVRIDGEDRRRLTDLAPYLPVSIVDAEVHELVQGAPGNRRRFLDWGVFHVEPRFLEQWKRYQRVLLQRNALLKSGNASGLGVWTAELANAGETLTNFRKAYIADFSEKLLSVGQKLLNAQVTCRYRPGWDEKRTLEEALQSAEARDLVLGSTQPGPHRAELELLIDGQVARENISRGQQKMLASALLLAQMDLYGRDHPRGALLLLDDPAAELDEEFLQRLLAEAMLLPAQLVITGLDVADLPTAQDHSMFHVEHGEIRAAS